MCAGNVMFVCAGMKLGTRGECIRIHARLVHGFSLPLHPRTSSSNFLDTAVFGGDKARQRDPMITETPCASEVVMMLLLQHDHARRP